MAADPRFSWVGLLVAALWTVIAAVTWRDIDVAQLSAKTLHKEKLWCRLLFVAYVFASVTIKAIGIATA